MFLKINKIKINKIKINNKDIFQLEKISENNIKFSSIKEKILHNKGKNKKIAQLKDSFSKTFVDKVVIYNNKIKTPLTYTKIIK